MSSIGSNLTLHYLQSPSNVVSVDPDTSLIAPGNVIQTLVTRIGPAVQSYASSDPQYTGLQIQITPKHANSIITVDAYLTSSQTYVNSFAIFRNGAPTISTGANSNSNEGNMQQTWYFGTSTTSHLYANKLTHWESAASTVPRTYAVYVTSAWSGGVQTVYLNNRSDNDMASFSYLVVKEITQ